MAKKRGGLGRGLESLIEDTAPSFESDNRIETLPLREIEPDPAQPRKTFDEETLAELAASISEHGLLQPIAVRPHGVDRYLIVAGERRWRACRMAGLTEAPVVVKDVTDEQAMELALVENLQREDLDPVEEALGIRELMTRCDLTQEQAARKLGKSRSPLVAAVTEDGRDGLHLGQLAGAEPPLPCHQLVTTLDLPHRDGLKQAVFPDALGQPRQLLFIKNRPSLKRRGTDTFHRQGVNLSGRFLPFKHDSFPFR